MRLDGREVFCFQRGLFKARVIFMQLPGFAPLGGEALDVGDAEQVVFKPLAVLTGDLAHALVTLLGDAPEQPRG